MKLVAFSLLLLTFFAGCDYVEQRVADSERADTLYRTAMEEYAAGRLDKAVEGLARVVKAKPGNASARFQLACLLQDHCKDPLGAICNYREYMTLSPKGDKIGIARDRTAACERQLATALIRKFNLGGSVAQDEANARLREDNAKLTADLSATKKELEKLKADFAGLQRENARVRRMVLTESSDDGVSEGAGKRAAAKSVPAMPDEKELLEEEDAASLDRVKFSSDVANLIAEEKEETSQAAPFGKTAKKPEEKAKDAPREPPHEKRPDYYVVQEGDTLFKLAIRFYGRRSAWVFIRDANKAVVSSDGRIKAGQKLRMP